ncbi:MAG: class I SAM-dependent methyltransferase [Deltaproteobacteria bacterium]|nr:class I SAM-dependent methyltransferase [Deltaproteobacteria bacterium]
MFDDQKSKNKLKKAIRQAILWYYKGYPLKNESHTLKATTYLLGMLLGLIPFVYDRAIYGLGKCFPPYKNNGSLLEVGCGRGWYLKIMRELGWKVLGLELNQESARKGSETYGVEIKEGYNLKEIPSSSFDVVTMIHVFEHLHNPEEVVSDIHRILKPGGILLLAMPNGTSLSEKLFGANYRALAPPWHLYIYNPKSITLFLEKFGFNVKATSRARNAGYVYNANKSILKRKFRREEEAFCLWFQILESFLNFFNPNIGEELEVVAIKKYEESEP